MEFKDKFIPMPKKKKLKCMYIKGDQKVHEK